VHMHAYEPVLQSAFPLFDQVFGSETVDHNTRAQHFGIPDSAVCTACTLDQPQVTWRHAAALSKPLGNHCPIGLCVLIFMTACIKRERNYKRLVYHWRRGR
jgi:hypothetical protein